MNIFLLRLLISIMTTIILMITEYSLSEDKPILKEFIIWTVVSFIGLIILEHIGYIPKMETILIKK